MTETSHGGGPRARLKRLLLVLCAAQLMVILDITAVNVAMPEMAMFLTGLTVFVSASVVAAASGSAGMLFAARGAQGLGAAILSPAALSVLMSTFRAGTPRAHALAAWGAVGGAGAAVGVLVGGLLTELVGWHQEPAAADRAARRPRCRGRLRDDARGGSGAVRHLPARVPLHAGRPRDRPAGDGPCVPAARCRPRRRCSRRQPRAHARRRADPDVAGLRDRCRRDAVAVGRRRTRRLPPRRPSRNAGGRARTRDRARLRLGIGHDRSQG